MSGNINFNGWLNDDGSENYKCRAWVNFNGTGTVAIRASGNVSSITDNGTGDFTLNFTNALVDTNYSLVGVSSGVDGVSYPSIVAPSLSTLFTTTTARVQVAGSNGDITAVRDPSIVCVSIFR